MHVSGLGCVGEMVFECCYDVAMMLLGCCGNGGIDAARRSQWAGG